MSSVVQYIGRYRLLNVVYTGQTSRTWQAYDDKTRQYVAIKTLLTKSSRDAAQVSMLKWEYGIVTKMDSPRVVKIHEFGWENKIPYVVMEWFPAFNLKQWVNKGYDNYCQYLPEMLTMMVESLIYIHGQKWIHRDIKPDNFLYNSDGGIKLVDYALAKHAANQMIPVFFKRRSKPQGTPSYMSPEQIRGLPATPSADIYSLGCTFIEMLTGRPPYTGLSVQDLLQKHLSAPAPSVIARNKNITVGFSDLIQMMLSKDPKKRPKSAKDLLLMLKGIPLFKMPPKFGDKMI